MTNYKPHLYSTIAGIQQYVPGNSIIKTLYQPSASTTTGLTFHDISTGANYQIPAASKFTVLGFQYLSVSGARRLITLYYADDVDGTSDEEDICIFKPLNTTIPQIPIAITPNENTTSTKYINMKVDNATNAPELPILYGYEILR